MIDSADEMTFDEPAAVLREMSGETPATKSDRLPAPENPSNNQMTFQTGTGLHEAMFRMASLRSASH